MRVAFLILSSFVTFAHAQVTTIRENTRRKAREIHQEIQKGPPSLWTTVVGSSTCNPETGELLAPEDPREPSVPCVALYYGSDEMAEQLKSLFGYARDGVPIAYKYRPPGPNVAFSDDVKPELEMEKVKRELETIFERPGVVSVGVGGGAIISVADPETERMLLEEYPPGSNLHGIPVVIERQQTYDARDPVVTPPCEPALSNRGWKRFKHRLKKFFSRPVR